MRKIKADHIFTGERGFLAGAVLTTGDDGTVISCNDEAGESSDIEYYEGILCPGFVNCHLHLELSWMRGRIPAGSGLHDFIVGLNALMKQLPKREEILYAAAEAEQEMYLNGIVAAGDISNSSVTIPLKEKGRLNYHHFIELFGSLPADAEKHFAAGLEHFRKASGLPRRSIVPHSPYSVSPELMKLIGDFAALNGSILSIHHQENEDENIFLADGSGPVYERLKAYGIQNPAIPGPGLRPIHMIGEFLGQSPNILLVHNTVSTAADVELGIRLFSNPWWVLCPRANLYIEGMLPDVEMIASYTPNIAIGTDSLASNTELSILGELQTLAAHFPGIPLEKLLSWATINGAMALSMDESFGSFGTGMKPGVNLITGIDSEHMRLTPESRVIPLMPC